MTENINDIMIKAHEQSVKNAIKHAVKHGTYLVVMIDGDLVEINPIFEVKDE